MCVERILGEGSDVSQIVRMSSFEIEQILVSCPKKKQFWFGEMMVREEWGLRVWNSDEVRKRKVTRHCGETKISAKDGRSGEFWVIEDGRWVEARRFGVIFEKEVGMRS